MRSRDKVHAAHMAGLALLVSDVCGVGPGGHVARALFGTGDVHYDELDYPIESVRAACGGLDETTVLRLRGALRAVTPALGVCAKCGRLPLRRASPMWEVSRAGVCERDGAPWRAVDGSRWAAPIEAPPNPVTPQVVTLDAATVDRITSAVEGVVGQLLSAYEMRGLKPEQVIDALRQHAFGAPQITVAEAPPAAPAAPKPPQSVEIVRPAVFEGECKRCKALLRYGTKQIQRYSGNEGRAFVMCPMENCGGKLELTGWFR